MSPATSIVGRASRVSRATSRCCIFMRKSLVQYVSSAIGYETPGNQPTPILRAQILFLFKLYLTPFELAFLFLDNGVMMSPKRRNIKSLFFTCLSCILFCN